ncbi:Beta-1 adrenergic receptor [Trichoplax sp. H2]|nr:Beta-1 adrenergic receptor [Trichoplax sp. H2]|eukprot:RDD39215.1 Beta-1 adrenergic receptor [Trichoplax sp. H2]
MWHDYKNNSFQNNQTVSKFSSQLPFIIISCTAVTLSLISNGILISIAIAYRKYLSPTEIIIANLSVSDVIFLISTVINALLVILPIPKPIFPNNSLLCRLIFAPTIVCTFVSFTALIILTTTRYYKITYPQKNLHWFSTATVKIAISCLWLVATIAVIPPVVGFWGKLDYFPKTGVCWPTFNPYQTPSSLSYIILFGGFGYLITTIIITYCYTKICITAFKSASRAHGRCYNTISLLITKKRRRIPTSVILRQKERKLSITLFMIVITYFISYSPYVIVQSFYLFRRRPLPIQTILTLCMISFINGITNPIIFISRSQKFQSFLCRRTDRRNTIIPSISHMKLQLIRSRTMTW